MKRIAPYAIRRYPIGNRSQVEPAWCYEPECEADPRRREVFSVVAPAGVARRADSLFHAVPGRFIACSAGWRGTCLGSPLRPFCVDFSFLDRPSFRRVPFQGSRSTMSLAALWDVLQATLAAWREDKAARLAAATGAMEGLLPLSSVVWQGINFLVSFGLITLVFALILSVGPDVAKVSNRTRRFPPPRGRSADLSRERLEQGNDSPPGASPIDPAGHPDPLPNTLLVTVARSSALPRASIISSVAGSSALRRASSVGAASQCVSVVVAG